eukprot:5142053-Prymnesium_polylepis.2
MFYLLLFALCAPAHFAAALACAWCSTCRRSTTSRLTLYRAHPQRALPLAPIVTSHTHSVRRSRILSSTTTG